MQMLDFSRTNPILMTQYHWRASASAVQFEIETVNRMDHQPTVFVIDDDSKMLRIISEVLSDEEIQVQTHTSGASFLAACDSNRRGCIVLDIQMPGLTGPELQSELAKRDIQLPVIFLTAAADVPMTVELMKRGAIDLIEKPFEVPALIAAVRKAIEHDAAAHEQAVQRRAILQRVERLTPREHEVMELVVNGHANKQIAFELKLSEKTVEIHRSRVMKKMEAQSLAELVRQCLTGTIPRPHHA